LTGSKEGWIGNIKFKKFDEIWNGKTRKKVLNNLDVKKCPHLCVGDNLNEFLDKIKNVNHKNFL
jgi:hypothetical protein